MPSTTATSLLDTIQDGTSPKNSQLRTGILRLLAAVWIQQHFIREFFGIRIQPAIDPVDHDMVLKRAVWKALHMSQARAIGKTKTLRRMRKRLDSNRKVIVPEM